MRIKIVRTALLLLLASVCIDAASLDHLVSSSDVIVIGTVTTRDESPTTVSFEINVEQVLKGDASAPIRVSQEWTRGGVRLFPPVQTIAFTVRGLWFLRSRPFSQWEALPASFGPGVFTGLFYPIAERPVPEPYQYESDAPLMDKLIFEVAAGLESNAHEASFLLDAVATTESAATRTVFSQYSKSADPGVQCVGIAGLIGNAEGGALQEVVKRWPVLHSQPNSRFVLFALGHRFRDRSPGSVRELVAIASDPDVPVDLRVSTAEALVAIHTREALPFLARLLESTDSSERMKGAFGLWSFANGCPPWPDDIVRSMDYYRFQNPSVYRTKETIAAFGPPGPADPADTASFWIAWWKDHTELHWQPSAER